MTDPVVPPVVSPAAVEPPVQNDKISTLRADLAALRLSRDDIARQKDDLAAKLAEAEAAVPGKIQAEVSKVQTKAAKLEEKLIAAELRSLAAEMQLADPDLLMHPLLDRSGIKITDDLEVTGVKEAFEALKAKKPEWFKPAATTTTATPARTTGAPAPTGQGTNPGPTDVTRMTKQEYEAWKLDQRRRLRTAG